MKLYTSPISSSARRVALVRAHLGLTLEEQLVDLGSKTDRTLLRAVNPNEKVPVLVDGDLVLFESHAIMQYLCDRTPGQDLYPLEPAARADVNRWLFWIASHMTATLGPIAFERLWKKFVTGADPDLANIARHEAMFRPFAEVVDAHLATRTWLSGGALSLADYSLAATFLYARPARIPLDDHRHLRDHLARVRELPAWRATDTPLPF